MLLEEAVFYDQCILLAKLLLALPCFILYSKVKLVCYSRYLLTSYFCIPVSYDEKDIFFVVVVVVNFSVSYLFAFSYCSWGSQGKNTEVVSYSLL